MIKIFSPTRRRFLVASAAGAVTLGAVGVIQWNGSASGRALWVENVVRKNLPGVQIDPVSLADFVREILESDLLKASSRKAALLAEQVAPWLTLRVPKIRNGLEGIERQVLTEYLLGGNFFRVSDPKREAIVYYGHATACANPFVRRA